MDIATYIVFLSIPLGIAGIAFILWEIADCLNRFSYIISTIIHSKSDKEKQEGDVYEK